MIHDIYNNQVTLVLQTVFIQPISNSMSYTILIDYIEIYIYIYTYIYIYIYISYIDPFQTQIEQL